MTNDRLPHRRVAGVGRLEPLIVRLRWAQKRTFPREPRIAIELGCELLPELARS